VYKHFVLSITDSNCLDDPESGRQVLPVMFEERE
jgi:hypothetical protein